MRSSVTIYPSGEVIWRRYIMLLDASDPLEFVNEVQGRSLTPSFVSADSGNSPVWSRMPAGVGRGAKKPPATRLASDDLV
jgi:hypothetical protein